MSASESNVSIVKELLRCGRIDRAIEISEQSISTCTPDSEDSWRFRFCLSDCLRTKGLTKESLEVLQSRGDSMSLQPELEALLRIHRGFVLGLQTRFRDALSEFRVAKLIVEQASLSTAVRIELGVRKGMVLFLAGDLSDSESNYREALSLSLASSDNFNESVAYAGIGKNAMARGDYKGAIEWQDKAMVIAKASGWYLMEAAMRSEIGWCKYKLGDNAEALECFNHAERMFRNAGALSNRQICLGNIGNVYLSRGDYGTSLVYYQDALRYAQQIGDRVSTAKWLSNLAHVASLMGNPVLAGVHLGKARAIRDLIHSEKIQAQADPK